VRPALAPLLVLGLAHCAGVANRLTIAYDAVAARVAADKVLIELDRSFIETYKNRVTIDATFTVDATSDSPNPGMFDGDLHFAGRAPEIGFRLVGEIMNAATVDSAVAIVHRAKTTEQPLRLTGVWRLWPEHAFGARQVQGDSVPPLTNANPDHVFEIHPITRLAGRDLLGTFHPVEGYDPRGGRRGFEIYEGAELELELKPETVVLDVSTGLYNDVHFILQLTSEKPLIVPDGRFVTAAVLDQTGRLLVERVRMVFTKGSAPERLIRNSKPGARLHVWGMPRVSFAQLSDRMRAAERNPALLKGKLPYEILVLAVYPEGS
jgi:hypothetical protein